MQPLQYLNKLLLHLFYFKHSPSDIICYDDACHLKRFVQNPKRCSKTTVATRLNEMEILCDRFHFKNHTDVWCRTHCNPNKSNNLQVTLTKFVFIDNTCRLHIAFPSF